LAGRLTHSRALTDHALYFRKRKMMSVEPNTEMDLMHRLMDVLGHEDVVVDNSVHLASVTKVRSDIIYFWIPKDYEAAFEKDFSCE
jgi:hypothetical protein